MHTDKYNTRDRIKHFILAGVNDIIMINIHALLLAVFIQIMDLVVVFSFSQCRYYTNTVLTFSVI